jgi:CHAD domain-containing protein
MAAPMPKRIRVHWDEQKSASENARRELPQMVAAYFAQVRDFLTRDPSPPQLHKLRLATKRLRYTLELFRTCYGPGLATRMGELRKLQQILGEVNDSVAAARRFSKVSSGSSQDERLRKFLAARAGNKAAEFRQYWTEVFDASGREKWWSLYLAREARNPRR